MFHSSRGMDGRGLSLFQILRERESIVIDEFSVRNDESRNDFVDNSQRITHQF